MRTLSSFPFDTSRTALSARRREAAFACTVGAAGVVAFTGLLVEAAGFAPRVMVAALLPFGVVAAVVLARVDGFHPHASFGPANRVTVARAVLNCVLIGLLADPTTLKAAWAEGWGWSIVAVAALSLALDGLDGYAARRSGIASGFGARFDVEVDALLLVMLAALAVVLEKAGPWVLASGCLYYGFLLARRTWPVLRQPLPPALWRKLIFVLQATALLAIALPVVAPPWSFGIALAALALLTTGFVVDLRWLLRHDPR